MTLVQRTKFVPLAELRFSFSTSSGPGGRNVDKTNTKVTLFWNLLENKTFPKDIKERCLSLFKNKINSHSELVISSDVHRSQDLNRHECINKLEAILQACHESPKDRLPTKPSSFSIEKRLEDKKLNHEKKVLRTKVECEEDEEVEELKEIAVSNS